MRISTRIRMLLESRRPRRERGLVPRLVALCCLCAALLAGFACTGAEENTAEEAPAVQELPASDGSPSTSTVAPSTEPDGSGTRGGQDAATPANEPATVNPVNADAEEVATSFLEAYGAFDVEQAISYLAEDADISGVIGSVGAHGVTGTLEEFRLLISLLEGQGYKQMLHSCEGLGSSASSTNLRCTFDFHAIRSDEIGLGPFRGSYFDLTVRDGQIDRASTAWENGEFSPQMWEPFAEWVSTAYPEDAAIMYTGGLSGARLTEESIRLWDQWSREYVDKIAEMVEAAESFMEARNAYDTEKAMSLLTDGPVRAQLLYDNAIHSDMWAEKLNHDELALALEAERLYGARYEPFECRYSGVAQVTCSYLMNTRLRQIEGYPPIESSFRLEFQEGHIELLSFPWLNISWNPGGMYPAEFEGFVSWLEDHHPEAGVRWPEAWPPPEDPRVFRTAGQEWILILTRESIDLLAGYLEEYERSING